MRTKHLLTKTLLLLAVMLAGVGSAWAEKTYKLTKVTSVEAGGLYVFEQSGYVMNNSVSSNALQTTTNYNISGLLGTETYVWTLETATDGFYLKNVSLNSNQYLNNSSSSTNVSFGSKSSIWTFAFTDGVALISNKSNSNRFLGYTTSTYAYKAYATSNLSSYSHDIIVYKLEEETGTNSDLALVGNDPVVLSFDLYNNGSAQVVNYTTSSTGEVTVSSSDYIAAVVDQSAKTITVTPTAVTPDVQTITVNQAATDSYRAGTVTFTVTIVDSTPIPTHTVTFSVNGTTTTQDFEEGAAIIFPSNLDNVEDKSFVGWVTEEITGTTDEAPTFVTSATMGTEEQTFFAVFADKTPGTQTTIKDVLTSTITGGNSSYSDWSGKTVTSDAVYAGNSAVANGSEVVSAGAIQMRTNNSNSGIISTTSGGTLKSVSVTWTGENERTLDIYGSNKAYSAASDLYDSSKQGTKLGSIVKGTSTSLTVSGDYAYVGIRSNNQALYLVDISIEWTTGTPDSYSAYCTTVATDTRAEAGISFAEATVTKEILDSYTGQTLANPNNVLPIAWTSSNEAVATVDEDGTVTILAVGETTITATFAGDDSYKKATASYTLTVQDSRTAPGFSFSETTAEASLGEDFTAPAFSNPNNVDVTFESTDETVATVDQNGNVTILAAGTTTIKATSEATTTYSAGEASYTLTVVDPNQPGTENNPYTVAQARAAIDAGTGVTNVYATGIVSEIVTAYSSQYGNITYNISTDGTTTADQLQAYRGKSYNGDSFTSEEDIQVGDVVVIYGSLTKYGSTYEFSANNQLVSLDRPVVTTPSISVSNSSIEATAEETEGTITVTYNNITEVVAEVYFCNAEGEETTYDWITAEINEETNNVDYLIEANEGDARTAYLKVYALDDEANDVYSELITITQAAYVAPEVTIGTFEKVTSTADITSGQYLIVYEEGRVAFNGSLETLDAISNTVEVIINNGTITATSSLASKVFTIDVTAGTLQAASGKYIGVSKNDNGLKTADEPTTYTHTFSIDDDGNAVISAVFDSSTMTLRYNSDSNQKRFRYYKSGQQAIQLYKFDSNEADETVSVTDAGYATYCSDKALDFSAVEGLTAYKATIANNQVTFTEVAQVAAGEGVLLKADEGTYAVPVAAYAAKDTSNAFIGVTESKTVDAGIFVLMGATESNKGTGFYKTTKSFTLSANTAYLPTLPESTRSFIALDEATSIEGIAAEKQLADGTVYNLQGQRVESSIFNVQSSMLKKGLYIVGGKKMLVK